MGELSPPSCSYCQASADPRRTRLPERELVFRTPGLQSMLTREPIAEAVPNAHLSLRYEALPSLEDQHVIALRRLIWIYFWLLVFEGALRKWIVPSLSAPLLVVRDPVAILIYLQAMRCRRFPLNGLVLGGFFLVVGFILLALAQIIAGVGGGVLVAA